MTDDKKSKSLKKAIKRVGDVAKKPVKPQPEKGKVERTNEYLKRQGKRK